MGEEIHTSDSENDGRHGEDERVLEWETGLPNSEDLVPLSQSLVPQKLASAFSINPEPYRSTIEVSRACEKTISIIRSQFQHLDDKSFHSFIDDHVLGNSTEDANDAQKGKKLDNGEEVDSISPLQSSNDDPHSRALKKPRLVWTPQLHKRFVDAVTHLGIKNVVPKTVMQLMNVEGLTRENVASHLQKYRLYIKRMQGLSSEGPSSTDNFFSSTHNSQEPGGLVHLPMPYMAPLVPMPVLGVPHGHGGMTNGFDHNHPYRLRE